jgi:hypothetical protein
LGASVLLSLGAGVAACDGTPLSGGDTFATTPGASVLFPSATGAHFACVGGGFGGVPPAGAACDPALWTYAFDLTAGDLAWSRCDVAGTGADPADYTPSSGDRTLAGSDLASAKAALGAVTVSAGTGCGADKESLTLEILSSSGNVVYGDDFYACEKQYAHYVTSASLDNLRTVFTPLAPD